MLSFALIDVCDLSCGTRWGVNAPSLARVSNLKMLVLLSHTVLCFSASVRLVRHGCVAKTALRPCVAEINAAYSSAGVIFIEPPRSAGITGSSKDHFHLAVLVAAGHIVRESPEVQCPLRGSN